MKPQRVQALCCLLVVVALSTTLLLFSLTQVAPALGSFEIIEEQTLEGWDESDPSPAWATERVDAKKSFSVSERSLALDSHDHRHVAYGGDHLYYAHNDGEQWWLETVDYGWKTGGIKASRWIAKIGLTSAIMTDSTIP